jgi:protein-disulfide isomerase
MTPLRLPIAIAALLAAAACQSKEKAAAAASADAPKQTAEGAAADQARIMGKATAPIWVVEVSDFQCPYCKMWHDSTYAALKREYVDAGKVRLAYINFPLSKHVNAMPAAEAAMCAAAQDKFWPMQDALFDAQAQWETMSDPTPAFESLAARSGVDVEKMRACIKSKVIRPVIEGDMDRARVAGVESTPSFLIGGQMLVGAQPMQSFRQAIDAALAAAAPGTKKP